MQFTVRAREKTEAGFLGHDEDVRIPFADEKSGGGGGGIF
jgi:hypothetical protein